MEDPGTMRGGERLGDLDRPLDRLVECERPACDPGLEGLAIDELHHDEVAPGVATDVEERADVRVVEPRDRTRLAVEALAPFLGSRDRRREQLERDRALEARVDRAIDLAHAAGADTFDDPVGTEAGSRRQRHS